jgi:hypothetical protein
MSLDMIVAVVADCIILAASVSCWRLCNSSANRSIDENQPPVCTLAITMLRSRPFHCTNSSAKYPGPHLTPFYFELHVRAGAAANRLVRNQSAALRSNALVRMGGHTLSSLWWQAHHDVEWFNENSDCFLCRAYRGIWHPGCSLGFTNKLNFSHTKYL